jgi:hypothetical protein
MDTTYANLLKQYLTQPGSYTGSPGYQFGLDQATQAAQRSTSGMRDSGNVMAELAKLGAGYASQDFGATIDRLGRLSGQEQQYDIGTGANANAAEGNRLTGVRDANSLALGTAANANTATRNANDLTLGEGTLANTAQRNTNDFGATMYDATNRYNLGAETNANTRENNWLGYALSKDRNNIDATANENTYNLNRDQQGINWFDANTRRGNATSNAALDWSKWNTALNPVRRTA